MTGDIGDMHEKYELVAGRLLSGKVVPVLGAGANLGDRPPGVEFEPGGPYLPNGRELAQVLARSANYPDTGALDLARVSQYVAAMLGEDELYEELHKIFNVDYPPTSLHYFLARLARRTRETMASECMLLITTNYDDALERAFQKEGEPYDLVTYINDVEEHRGHFRHTPFGGEPKVILKPNEYTDLPLDRRTVIAKIHGAVDRLNRVNRVDSFVITEDHYVDYITHADIERLFPVTLAEKIKRSHFLFLGYSLRDWNVRVMLYRLRRKGANRKSWAIEADPDSVDRVTWIERGVDILPVRVENFVAAIEQRLPFLEPEFT